MKKKNWRYAKCYFKQEAHGPHRSPEKPVEINEYI